MQLRPIFKFKLPFTKRLFARNTCCSGQYGIYVYNLSRLGFRRKFRTDRDGLGGFSLYLGHLHIKMEDYVEDIADPCMDCYYDAADCIKDVIRNYEQNRENLKPCYYIKTNRRIL